MNFILLNYEFPPLGGGAGNATAELARALVRAGHAVSVLTCGFGSGIGAEKIGQLEIIRLPARRASVDRSSFKEMLSYVWHAWWALPSLLRRQSVGGVIVFFTLPCGPLAWYARKRFGVPYVVSLRGGDVPGLVPQIGAMHAWLAPIRRMILRGARAVVANSTGLAELSERSDPVHVEVVPNGVDIDFFCPAENWGAPREEVRVLFVGRFHDQKNLFVLLDQFAAAANDSGQRLRLTLIGDGPQRAALIAHARTLATPAGAVEFPGWLDKAALREAYRNADIFVNPSLYEGMPNTVLEAMATGLPVVASNVPGNDELVRPHATGLLFELDRPEQLSAHIQTLAENAPLRLALGGHARRVVGESYSWSTTAARYADFFIGTDSV